MPSSSPSRPGARPRRRPDVRGRALSITALATVALGAVIAWWPQDFAAPSVPDMRFRQVFDARPPSRSAREAELRNRFEQGVAMLHMRQHEYAVKAFERVLTLAPGIPEAHANMGFALVGLEQWDSARRFFESAIDLRRDQINAYYGLAVALEGLGDMAGAMGAMQVYLHRAPSDDPFRTRAESALWEWREAASQAPSDGAAPGNSANDSAAGTASR